LIVHKTLQLLCIAIVTTIDTLIINTGRWTAGLIQLRATEL